MKEGRWCYAFEDALALETVLGASFMIAKDVVFDVGNTKIGFVEANCPIVDHRDDFPPKSSSPTVPKVTTTPAPSTLAPAPAGSPALTPAEGPATTETSTPTKLPTATPPTAEAASVPGAETLSSLEGRTEETVDLPAGSTTRTVSLVLMLAALGAIAAIARLRRRRAAEDLERSSLTTTVGIALEDRDIWLQPVVPLQ